MQHDFNKIGRYPSSRTSKLVRSGDEFTFGQNNNNLGTFGAPMFKGAVGR